MTASTQGVSTPKIANAMLMKVPEITLIFWVAKLGTTAFGETFSDYIFFNDYIGRNTAILMGLGFLLVCLARPELLESCPDWEVPCKHIAAVFYLLAEAFDDDPFSILAWRGRSRADLLAGLHAARGGVECASMSNTLLFEQLAHFRHHVMRGHAAKVSRA